MTKPDGMKQEVFERYISDGFNQEDIERIWQETLYSREQMAINRNIEPREITCQSYKNSQKRTDKAVKRNMGVN